MKVGFHTRFKKQYKKLSKGEQRQFDERLALFVKDPHHPILNNHLLHGKYKEFRSINVTGDLRALYKEVGRDSLLFVTIDTHSNLYS